MALADIVSNALRNQPTPPGGPNGTIAKAMGAHGRPVTMRPTDGHERHGDDVVNAPQTWQSSPGHPVTHLAYITDAEHDVLSKLDMHGSGVDQEEHHGPHGIPSLDGAGDDSGGSQSTGNSYGGGTMSGGGFAGASSGYGPGGTVGNSAAFGGSGGALGGSNAGGYGSMTGGGYAGSSGGGYGPSNSVGNSPSMGGSGPGLGSTGSGNGYNGSSYGAGTGNGGYGAGGYGTGTYGGGSGPTAAGGTIGGVSLSNAPATPYGPISGAGNGPVGFGNLGLFGQINPNDPKYNMPNAGYGYAPGQFNPATGLNSQGFTQQQVNTLRDAGISSPSGPPSAYQSIFTAANAGSPVSGAGFGMGVGGSATGGTSAGPGTGGTTDAGGAGGTSADPGAGQSGQTGGSISGDPGAAGVGGLPGTDPANPDLGSTTFVNGVEFGQVPNADQLGVNTPGAPSDMPAAPMNWSFGAGLGQQLGPVGQGDVYGSASGLWGSGALNSALGQALGAMGLNAPGGYLSSLSSAVDSYDDPAAGSFLTGGQPGNGVEANQRGAAANAAVRGLSTSVVGAGAGRGMDPRQAAGATYTNPEGVLRFAPNAMGFTLGDGVVKQYPGYDQQAYVGTLPSFINGWRDPQPGTPVADAIARAYEAHPSLPEGYLQGMYGTESNYGRLPDRPGSKFGGPLQYSQAQMDVSAPPGQRDRYNPYDAMNAAARDYEKFSAKIGRPLSGPEGYVMHQQGLTGGANLIENGDMMAGDVRPPGAIEANNRSPIASASSFVNSWGDPFSRFSDYSNPTFSGYAPNVGTRMTTPGSINSGTRR